MDCSIPGFPVLHISQSLLKLMSTELVTSSNYLILCHPLLLLPLVPALVFSNQLALYIKWPKIGVSALTSVHPMNIQGWFPGFPDGSDGKESACSMGDPGLIPRSRWSPGEGNIYPLQYPCLQNSMNRGTWWARVQSFRHNWKESTKSQMQLKWFSIHTKRYVRSYSSVLVIWLLPWWRPV